MASGVGRDAGNRVVEYVDVAITRWQAFTGKKAALDDDGRSFSESHMELHDQSEIPRPGAIVPGWALSFAADRNQLYAAWRALANRADLCGNVTVSVKAEAPQA